MSPVFDALLRAESERHGVDLSDVSSAIQLLQLAEHKSIDSQGSQPLHLAGEADSIKITGTADVILSANAGRVDPFSQFQPLAISISPQSRLVCLTDSDSLADERFRYLGVRLQQIRKVRQLRTLLITSTIPEEGKSMVAANLACTLARKPNQKVLILDGDLRRPSITAAFGLGNIPGMYELLQNKRDLMASIYQLNEAGVWILPAGNVGRNPLELLQSARLSALIDQLNSWFDWVILDSPPLLTLADTVVWARLADGVLLVTRKGTTEKRLLNKCLESLDKKKLIGALLNSSQNPNRYEHYYHYRPSTIDSRQS